MATGSIPKYADGMDSGWITLTPASSFASNTGSLRYRMIGKEVCIIGLNLNLFAAWSSGASKRLYTGMPSAARPPIHAIGFGGNKDKYVMIQSTDDGNLNVYRNSSDTWATSDNISFVLTYLSA